MVASIVVLGQGCVWYSGQFWALFYLHKVKNVDVLSSSYIIRHRAADRHPDPYLLGLAL